jgi:hypothetical protein
LAGEVRVVVVVLLLNQEVKRGSVGVWRKVRRGHRRQLVWHLVPRGKLWVIEGEACREVLVVVIHNNFIICV